MAETFVHIDSGALPASKLSIPSTRGSHERLTSRGVVWQRMLRVIRFDRSVYPEIESDPSGTRQAAAIVAIVAAAAVIGTVLLGNWRAGALVGTVAAALIHWLLWSALENLIGMALFQKQTSLTNSVRTLGYAQAPQLLAFFAFVPVVGSWIVMSSRVMTLIAGSQALTTRLQLRRRQTLAIRLVSFGIALAAAALVRAALGDLPWLTALLRP